MDDEQITENARCKSRVNLTSGETMRTDEQIKSASEAIESEINYIKNESSEGDSFSVSLQKSIKLSYLIGKLDMLIWITKEIK